MNTWHRWLEDLELAASMGLNAFRFSTQWARIEPALGQFDEQALDHYEAVVDGRLERGLAPIVTFSHFTAPHWFAMRGGWLDPDARRCLRGSATAVMDRFGDRIAVAVTLNEPNLHELLASMDLPDMVAELNRATLQAAVKQPASSGTGRATWCSRRTSARCRPG